jgi:hypothetical protein
MDIDDIAIERIAVEDLREDRPGVLIGQIASLAYRAFRESPTTSKGRACISASVSI